MSETDRTVQEQIVREAPDIEAFKLGLLQSSRNLANIPLQNQIPQQKVAGLAQSGRQTLGAGLGVFNQGIGALSSAERQLGSTGGRFQAGPGYTAERFGGGPGYTAQGFDPSTISQFQNPFEDQAVQQALADIRREGEIASNQQNAAAVQTGAFGGSRDILARGELGRNVLEQQGRTAAGMRQAGFQNAALQAQQAFEDAQRREQSQAQFGTQTRQQAFEADKTRGLQRGQQYQGIAGQYGNLGQAGSNVGMQQIQAAQQAQNQGLKEIGTAQTLGGLEQRQQQAQLDSDYNLQRQRLYEPYTRLSWLSDQYKGAPSSQSSLGSITSPTAATPSAVQQIGAIGTGILGAAGGAKQLGLF